MRGLEESGIQPVNDSQLSKQSLDALIGLEQEIQTELNGKSKLLLDETEQQMKTEHPMHEYSFLQKKTGWLNDTKIDSAMNLLQYQFPDLEGFQSCTLAVQPDFERHQKLFIQIINRSPYTKGTHWLTVSNLYVQHVVINKKNSQLTLRIDK